MAPPTVISTFSGVGGSSLGYEMAGFKVRLAVEWDDHAVACYRLNFPATPVYHGDIGQLQPAEALALAGLQPGELDVLDGSPPCQGFSTAGKRSFYDGRNQLFREYVRLLRGLRPRAFVMENVSGMVKGKMLLTFADCMRELKASGYRVSARLLNAMYFGVPQSRERVIFVGVREDLGVEPSHPAPQTDPIPLCDVLPSLAAVRSQGNNPWRPSTLPAATITKTSNYEGLPKLDDAYGRLWPRVPWGGSAKHVLKGVRPNGLPMNHPNNGSTSCLKPHPRRPAPTLPKTQTGRGFATVVHPTEPRPLTIEEAKIIGSFPASFQLVGSYVQQWARIGNSVPPLLMRAIAEHLRDEVLAKAAAGGGGAVAGDGGPAPVQRP